MKNIKRLQLKEKREIARTIREKTLEDYNNSQQLGESSIDLGVFGNANLSLGQDSYEYTTNVLSAFSDLVDYGTDGVYARNDVSAVSNPKLTDLTSLQIDFEDLERWTQKAASNLRKAYKNAVDDGIQFEPSRYRGDTEANRLTRMISQLRKFIDDRTKNSKGESTFNFGSDESGNVTSFFQLQQLLNLSLEYQKMEKG